MLEIGGGLGLAAVLAAKSGARVTATDVLPAAVEAMRANAALNGVTVDTRLGDCYAPVAGRALRSDLHESAADAHAAGPRAARRGRGGR